MLKRGFTLIELMVAVSIFAAVAVIATGAVLSANSASKRAQAIKLSMDNLSFALDSMTLKLKKGGGYYCQDDPFSSALPIFPSAEFRDCPIGGEAIAFRLDDGTKYIYQVNQERLEFSQSDQGNSNTMLPFVKITADELSIQNAKFYVAGNGTNSSGATDLQPRVLISIYGVAQIGHETTNFSVQTTVSDRR